MQNFLTIQIVLKIQYGPHFVLSQCGNVCRNACDVTCLWVNKIQYCILVIFLLRLKTLEDFSMQTGFLCPVKVIPPPPTPDLRSIPRFLLNQIKNLLIRTYGQNCRKEKKVKWRVEEGQTLVVRKKCLRLQVKNRLIHQEIKTPFFCQF